MLNFSFALDIICFYERLVEKNVKSFFQILDILILNSISVMGGVSCLLLLCNIYFLIIHYLNIDRYVNIFYLT